MIHTNAIVDPGVELHSTCKVYPFSHVQLGCVIGENCSICENVFIEKGAVVGSNVTIKNGVQVWNGIIIDDNVFIGPNTTFTNDMYPRSKKHDGVIENSIRICKGASLGANCTILPDVTVGENSIVGAGSVVTCSVAPNSIVAGNPAKHLRFIYNESNIVDKGGILDNESIKTLFSSKVEVFHFKSHRNPSKKGDLIPFDYSTFLPWIPKQMFVVTNVPSMEVRGNHAHHSLKEFLVCVNGSVKVLLDDGENRIEVVLDTPEKGILLNAMIWSTQVYMQENSSLLVLCSEAYDRSKYIDDYSEFVMKAKQLRGGNVLKQLNNTEDHDYLRVPFLNLIETHSHLRQDFHTAFSRVLDSGTYILGKELDKFEDEWARFCGAAYCVGVSNGLAALHLMLLASGIKANQEVIVPSNTYIATVLAVTMAGGIPIFVEPDPHTHVLDVNRIEEKITNLTHCILTVDLYGQTTDMDTLNSLGEKHGILVFADGAQSHGAMYKNRRAGSLCCATTFSFYPGKNLGAFGDAGAVVTNDIEIANKIRVLRNYGSKVKYYNEVVGFNERMDPLQAALLSCKIPHLQELNNRRIVIAQKYLSGLLNVQWLSLPHVPDYSIPCWHQFVVTLIGVNRSKVMESLASFGIDSLIHYPIPPHLQDAYKHLNYHNGDFPIAESLAESVLSLPICPSLSDEQINHVIMIMKKLKL